MECLMYVAVGKYRPLLCMGLGTGLVAKSRYVQISRGRSFLFFPLTKVFLR